MAIDLFIKFMTNKLPFLSFVLGAGIIAMSTKLRTLEFSTLTYQVSQGPMHKT